jgi:hypothetical protein
MRWEVTYGIAFIVALVIGVGSWAYGQTHPGSKGRIRPYIHWLGDLALIPFGMGIQLVLDGGADWRTWYGIVGCVAIWYWAKFLANNPRTPFFSGLREPS